MSNTLEGSKPSKKLGIHVICGGGSGGEILRTLQELGYRLSAGVLIVLDSDLEVAETLNISVIHEASFSPIIDENHKEHLSLIHRADVVLVTDLPFGYINIRNMEAARTALRMEKKVILIGWQCGNGKDYTSGRVTAIFGDLEAEGAFCVQDQKEAFSTIENLEKIESQDGM